MVTAAVEHGHCQSPSSAGLPPRSSTADRTGTATGTFQPRAYRQHCGKAAFLLSERRTSAGLRHWNQRSVLSACNKIHLEGPKRSLQRHVSGSFGVWGF